MSGSLFQREGEPEEEYARRLTRAVHLRMRHYWAEDNGVSASENWVLWGVGHVAPVVGLYQRSDFENWEFVNYERALERGYGLCSQHALAVADVLRRQDVPHSVLALDGHVVVEAPLAADGGPVILDADYGVTLPAGIEEIGRDTAAIRAAYAEAVDGAPAPYGSEPVESASLLRQLERIYASPNRRRTIGEVAPLPNRLEALAYVLKWWLPATAVVAGLGLAWAGRRRRARGSLPS